MNDMIPENDKKKRFRLWRWATLAVLMILMVAGYITLGDKITLQSVQAHKQQIMDFVATHSVLAPAMYMGIYAAAVSLSLPFATVLTLLGGFVFGKWWGTLYVVIAATTGATIVFGVGKTALGRFLRERAKEKTRTGILDKIGKNIRENAVGYLLFTRLVPVFPFFVINIVPAIFNVPTKIYVLTTLIGIIPGSFVYTNLGEALGDIDSAKGLLSGEVLFAFVLLGTFALLPTLYKQYKKARGKDLADMPVTQTESQTHD